MLHNNKATSTHPFREQVLFLWKQVFMVRNQGSQDSLCVCVCVLSYVQLFTVWWTVALQAPLSMGFPRQGYWSGLLFPSPGDLPDPGSKCLSTCISCIADGFFTAEPPEPAAKLDGHHWVCFPRIVFFFFFFFGHPQGLWDLSSLIRDQTRALSSESAQS